MVLGDGVTVVITDARIVGVIVSAVFEIALYGAVDIAVGAVVGTVVRDMVRDDIRDDLDAVAFRLGAQRGQLRLGTEP